MHRAFLILIPVLALSAQPNLPGMAEGILEQSKIARQAVAAYDKNGALDHIKQGLSLADEIRRDSPDARPILVPVYKELDTTTTYANVKHKDGEMSADRLKKETSIRGVSGELTTKNLDVMAAAEHLRSAQSLAESGDWTGADAALAGVASSVVVSQSQGGMPIDMARQNLELARLRVIDGKFKDAAVPLRSAADALANFEKVCTGQRVAEVEAARQAIVGYSESVSRNHEGAEGRIDGWLASLKQWSDQ